MELNDYLSPKLIEELFVDTSRNPNMSINLNIIFPTISCDCKHNKFNFKNILLNLLCYILVLALDAMDSSGEQHLMLQHQIFKRKLDLNGQPIEEPKKEGKLW